MSIKVNDIMEIEQKSTGLVTACRNARLRSIRKKVRPKDLLEFNQSAEHTLALLKKVLRANRGQPNIPSRDFPDILRGLDVIADYIHREPKEVLDLIENEALPVSLEHGIHFTTRQILARWQNEQCWRRYKHLFSNSELKKMR